jgi:hypothetical protein
MARYYPTRNDLDTPDKLERTVKDIYDRIYMPSKDKPKKAAPRRIDINTGKRK